MKKSFSVGILLLVLSATMNATAQGDVKKTATGQTKKWFDKKEWLSGLQLKPHKTVNIPELARQYQLNKSYWDKAFAFLKEHDLQTLDLGKVSIDGENVYAMITQNATKDFDSTKWESHRKFVDLQYVISGQEKIGVSPIEQLTVVVPYDASKDLANYSGKGKIYSAVPETFFLFFPTDAHRPNITPGGNQPDKKIVIKIKYAD